MSSLTDAVTIYQLCSRTHSPPASSTTHSGRFNMSLYNAISLYTNNICNVCGSFSCPYCPDFNWASIGIKAGMPLLLGTLVALAAFYCSTSWTRNPPSHPPSDAEMGVATRSPLLSPIVRHTYTYTHTHTPTHYTTYFIGTQSVRRRSKQNLTLIFYNSLSGNETKYTVQIMLSICIILKWLF